MARDDARHSRVLHLVLRAQGVPSYVKTSHTQKHGPWLVVAGVVATAAVPCAVVCGKSTLGVVGNPHVRVTSIASQQQVQRSRSRVGGTTAHLQT